MEQESPKMTSRLRSRRLASTESEKDKPVHRTPQKKTPGRPKQNEFDTPSKADTPRRITRRGSLTAESSPANFTPKRTRAQSLAVIDEIKDVNFIQNAGMIRNCYVLVKKLNIKGERKCDPDAFQTPKDENKNKIVKRFRNNIKKSSNSLVDDSNNTHVVDGSNKAVKKQRGRRRKNLNETVDDNKDSSNENNISSEPDTTSSLKQSPIKNKNDSVNMESEKADKMTLNVSSIKENESSIKENEPLNENTKNKSLINFQSIEEYSEKNDSHTEKGNDNESDPKEMNDSQIQLDNQSDEHKVTFFEESLIEHNRSSIKYVKTPYLSKTKSILDENISAINTSLKGSTEELDNETKKESFNFNYSITENKNDKENSVVKEVKYNKITPFKKLSRDKSLPSSTPVNRIDLKARPHSIDSKKDQNQKESNFSWSQSTHGKAGNKLDCFDEKEKNEVAPITTQLKTKSKRNVSISDDEEEEGENEEEVNIENEFIDDEALVGENESIDSEERQYLNDNEIPVDGISLGSEDSDMHSSDEEYEKDSFVVSEEEVDLLSTSEEERMEDSKKSTKFKRIQQVSSDSESESITPVLNNNKNSDKSNLHLSMQQNESVKDVSKYDLPEERHSIYIPDNPNKSSVLWQNNNSVEKANITLAHAADEDEKNDPLNASTINKKDDSHFIDANNMTVFDQQNSDELDPLNVSRCAVASTEKNINSNLSLSMKKLQSPSVNISVEKSFNIEISENQHVNKDIERIILKLNTPDRKISEKQPSTKSPRKVTTTCSKLSTFEDVENKHNKSKEKDCKLQTDSEKTVSADLSLKEKKEKTILNDDNTDDDTDIDQNVSSDKVTKDMSVKNMLADVEKNYNESEDEDYNPPDESENSSDTANSSLKEKEEISISNNDNKEWETIMQTSDTSTNSDGNILEDMSTSIKINSERVKELAKGFCDKSGWANTSKSPDNLLNQSNENYNTNQNIKYSEQSMTTKKNESVEKAASLESNLSEDSDTKESNENEKENLDTELSNHSRKLKSKEKNYNILNPELKSEPKLTMQDILSRCDAILNKAEQDKNQIKSKVKKNNDQKKKSIKKSNAKKMLKDKRSFEKIEELDEAEKELQNELKAKKVTIISSKISTEESQKKSKLLSKDFLNAINTDYGMKEADNFKSNEIKIGKKRKHSDEPADEEQTIKHHKKIKFHNNEILKLAEDELNTKEEKTMIGNENIKKSKKRKMSEEEETVVSKLKIFKSSSGLVYEEPLTPESKKKNNIISKFKTKAGIVIEQPLTPVSKKVQNGFIEAPLTPRPIGYKVRKILSAGQQEIPAILKSSEEKKSRNKINIREPTSILPKPVWSKSGIFYEKKLSNVLSTIPIELNKACSTEFGVCPLESKKSKTRFDLNAKAMIFKAESLKNEKHIRECSKNLLRRKARQNIFKKF